MESPNLTLWNLKEEAKWARTAQGQIQAIQQLGTFGDAARPLLEEILAVSVSEEIRRLCIETMNAINGAPSKEDTLETESQKNKKNLQEKSRKD